MTTKQKVVRITSGLVFSLMVVLPSGKPLLAQGTNAGDARGQWTTTGSLNAARTDHTATLLLDGRVLVVGGGGNGILDSAELFDPTTGTWNVTGHLKTARFLHTATLLPDGRVLVAGGWVGQSMQSRTVTNTAELYDPATGTWSSTGNMTMGRGAQTATLLSSGKVLITGGEDMFTEGFDQTELYDPTNGTWSRTGDFKMARIGPATRLQDSKVLVAGGLYNIEFPPLASAELYDGATGTWDQTASLAIARYGNTMTLLQAGKVLVAGGGTFDLVRMRSAELYDPLTRRWDTAGALGTARSGATATLLQNGKVLVVGGQEPQLYGMNDAELYDPVTATWAATGNLNVPRSHPTATLLRNGQVLIAGGDDAFRCQPQSPCSITALKSAELYGQAASPGFIGPAITGSWYDPAQSGHGLFIEVLSDNRFYASWFAFNPAGTQQAWFTGVGTYSGNTATIVGVEQPTGGRWIPNFDPNQVVHNAWGTLTFTFADCDHGKVDFNSVAGYGSGSMNLTRLTQPAGLSCP
jgi:hypothetical protein